MSIRPSTIDRCGERPCIPGFYALAKRMAEGRAPSLTERVFRALANLRKKLARWCTTIPPNTRLKRWPC